MAKGADYRLKKLEKGPLQRFKNQNHLIKKFGEVGLQVYKAITGKRTSQELQNDLGVDPALFDKILTYMEEAGMIELQPVGAETVKKPKAMPEEAPEEAEEAPEEVTLEELPEEPEEEPDEPPLDEEKAEEPPEEEEIAPLDFEEIKPIDTEFGDFEEKKPAKKKTLAKEPEGEEEFEPIEEPEEPEEEPEQPEEPEETEISALEEEETFEESSDLSPVEKIISDKYGDIGLRVYALIDGQRTAEEIMQDTGLTETKLVEILDFMDEQGIIKLDYPKKRGAAEAPTEFPRAAQRPAAPPEEQRMGFVPMIEDDERLDEARGIISPVEMPIKAPLDIVKSVQMKAKVMLKFGEKGSKLLELIDGKNDTIDIPLKLDIPLYRVMEMLSFMMQAGMVIVKPLSRADVRKKYGDDGYSVYKKYGKEGLMLYELIGKEMTIKQMADMITKNKETVVDMFIFIHQVLGIELPIDKDVLKKQLGI